MAGAKATLKLTHRMPAPAQNIATKEDIDNTMKLGMARKSVQRGATRRSRKSLTDTLSIGADPMGPLQLADLCAVSLLTH